MTQLATHELPQSIIKELRVDSEGKGSVSRRGLARMCGINHQIWGRKGGSKFTPKVDKYLVLLGYDISQIDQDMSIDCLLACDVISFYAVEEQILAAQEVTKVLVLQGMRSEDKTLVSSPIIQKKKQKADLSPKGFVYAVKLDGCIKVGFSKDVEQRLKAYRTGSFSVELIYTAIATQNEERQFHKKYNSNQEKYDLEAISELFKLLRQTFGCHDPILL